MKTCDGQVDYHISIDHDVVVDIPTFVYPESHLNANLVFETKSLLKTTIKRKKRKSVNKDNE